MAIQKIISFVNISKVFSGHLALDDVNFHIRKNEIHSIIGENGAGKSSLMHILVGINKPSLGFIEHYGKRIKIRDVKHAFELKIALVQQKYELIENMTVEENIILGYEKLYKKEVGSATKLASIAQKYDLSINIKSKVSELSPFEKQKVEMLKALWRGAEIIIFDEPTSYFTHSQTKLFSKMLKKMKSVGKTIVIITNRPKVALEISERITIIKNGKHVQTKYSVKTNEKEIIKKMLNNEEDLELNKIKRTPIDYSKRDVLVMRGVYNKENLKNIYLEIKPGEILGIAAIEGNGQSELIKAIAGIIPVKGKIAVGGTEIQDKPIYERYYNLNNGNETLIEHRESFKFAIEYLKNDLDDLKNLIFLEENRLLKRKMVSRIKPLKKQIYHLKVLRKRPEALISHIPEERHLYGIIIDYSIAKNSVLQDINFYTKKGVINYKDINLKADSLIKKYNIEGVKNNRMKVKNLTIGNQQKLIIGREIERNPILLLASYPSNGLDSGSIKTVYENIIEARNNGMAVLLNSSSLDEIMQVSDKIIVMHDGKIISTSKRGELSKTMLSFLMEGGESEK